MSDIEKMKADAATLNKEANDRLAAGDVVGAMETAEAAKVIELAAYRAEVMAAARN
jgi:hypothetical protein